MVGSYFNQYHHYLGSIMHDTSPIHHEALAEERRANIALALANFIKRISLLPITVMVVGWILNPAYPQLLANAVSMLPIFLSALIYPTLYNKGHKRAGLRLIVGAIYFTILTTPFVFSEMITAVAAGLGILYIIAYYLLGVKDARWYAITATVIFAAHLVMGRYMPVRLFNPLDETAAFFINLFISTFIGLGTVTVVHMVQKEQDNLHRLQAESNYKLDAAARQAKESRERLERMVRICVDYMSEVSNGNLSARLCLEDDGQTDSPMMRLARSLTAMTASVRGMITKIKDAAEDLRQATVEILAATTQQAGGASEQSSAISQTSVTVDELRTIAEHSLQRAQELAELSQRSVEVARSGKQSVESTVNGMHEIRSMVERIAENILSLSERTQRIGEIITTVNEIASQSNMLALNASVEAARAGEHGKGFAVVASEVRSLAEESRQATAQVRAILSDIQKATNATVMVTEEGTKGVDRGVALANQTGESIEKLTEAIEATAQAALQMAAGGRQQMSGVEQVAIAIQSINQATVQNLTSTRQAEHAAQDLHQLAESLTQMIAAYNVSEH